MFVGCLLVCPVVVFVVGVWGGVGSTDSPLGMFMAARSRSLLQNALRSCVFCVVHLLCSFVQALYFTITFFATGPACHPHTTTLKDFRGKDGVGLRPMVRAAAHGTASTSWY